ncbi:transcriptional regulator with XRE-family HTH domain [Kribbella sp. VKM Ac-2571]|uniref:helix-turn-helix transcriptional regulator n=1 Tax=Kribbella sp. VKM Ac-2571 TaxID=2512222 RepID=UPI0010DD3262|nr:helix-turn-helix domain-containing protein [Kribbella sp. VKM Ac-2571]TDO69412.1 transcriptional regulator with XRE-family HTH domain [Kribbella sp. VKM Ac-2571]
MTDPEFGSDEWQVEYYRHEFAYLLRSVRKRAGKTVREIAEASNYSHPHIARSLKGTRFPNWKLVRAILNACGVGGDQLNCWLRLWKTASATQSWPRPSSAHEPGRRTWVEIQQEWEARTTAIRQPDATLLQIQQVVTLEQLGRVLTALSRRQGYRSLRRLEELSGVSRSTLHGWYAGQRKPTAARLHRLAVALGATQAEQLALIQCLSRISPLRRPPAPERPAACAANNPSLGQHCKLPRFHQGPHQATVGESWLDDGVLDGRSGTAPHSQLEAVPTRRVHFGPGW